MRYTMTEVLEILKPLRKETGKYKVWNTQLKNYSPALWHDLERVKQGLKPLKLQINNLKR